MRLIKIVGDNQTELIPIRRIIGVGHHTYVIASKVHFMLNVRLTRNKTICFNFANEEKCLEKFNRIEKILQKKEEAEAPASEMIDVHCQVKIRKEILDIISVEKLREYLISYGWEFECKHINSDGETWCISDSSWKKYKGEKYFNFSKLYLYPKMTTEQKLDGLKTHANATGRNVLDVLFELGSRIEMLVDVFPTILKTSK